MGGVYNNVVLLGGPQNLGRQTAGFAWDRLANHRAASGLLFKPCPKSADIIRLALTNRRLLLACSGSASVKVGMRARECQWARMPVMEARHNHTISPFFERFSTDHIFCV